MRAWLHVLAALILAGCIRSEPVVTQRIEVCPAELPAPPAQCEADHQAPERLARGTTPEALMTAYSRLWVSHECRAAWERSVRSSWSSCHE